MLRHVVLPFAFVGGCLAADGSPIADVRLTADVGMARRTTVRFDVPEADSSSAIDSTPLRFSLGYVRGLGTSATQGPLAAIELAYERGGGRLVDERAAQAMSTDRVDSQSLALDVAAGWAAVVPTAPRLHVEALLFVGYVMERDDFAVPSAGFHTDLAGRGYETGARVSAIRTGPDGWQVGATARYLFEHVVDEDLLGGSRRARFTSDGLSLGLVLGRRL